MMITDASPIGRLTIDMLSDDILLYIFDIYRQELKDMDDLWPWHTLVHVCRRWRHVIFAWPHHLDLRLDGFENDIMGALDIWPADLLLVIWSDLAREDGDDIVVALGLRDRIASITLYFRTTLQLERCTEVMQESFPVLRTLFLHCDENDSDSPVVISAFLGGSAPRLQRISLCRVPFPTLPMLLLSTKDLVVLNLDQITSAGYISPDALATSLSMLKRLDYLGIFFQSIRSFPSLKNRPPPPLTRAVLPALKTFVFEGVSEYSEDLIARIDTPLLSTFSLHFFYQPIFDIPQIPQFFSRVEKFKPPFTADIDLFDRNIDASLSSPGCDFFVRLNCDQFFTPPLLLEQIFTQFLPHTSHVHRLKLNRRYTPELGQQDPALWLRFLRPFTAVQFLDVTGDRLGLDVAHILSVLALLRAPEVLPMLHTVVMHGSEGIEHMVTHLLRAFIDARKLSDCPVVVSWMPQGGHGSVSDDE
jgi:hypothetical protein